jgi:hypothetical protein
MIDEDLDAQIKALQVKKLKKELAVAEKRLALVTEEIEKMKQSIADVESGVLDEMLIMKEMDQKNHWLLRIGNGNNFKNSSKFNIWGVKQTTNTKSFEKLVKKGDVLWFIVSRNNGQAIAFAEYINHNARTKTDQELGWETEPNSHNWTIEINYEHLTNVEDKNLYTCIVGQNVNIRKYNEKCKINLPQLFAQLSV